MSKGSMTKHILTTYKGIQQSILLAQLDYPKNNKFYGWNVEGNKFRLINRNGDYTIEAVI